MTQELKYVKEYLTTGTGTEGSLLIPKMIYDTLIEEVDKALIPRSEIALYFGPAQIPGSSIDVDLVTTDSMDVRVVVEGAEIPIDQVAYESFNLKPKKYGVAIRITRELMEDAKWNLLEHNIRIAGKRLAENENSLIISDALEGYTSSVSGGAAVTVANIARVMQYIDDADYAPTTFLVGMEVLNDLRNIDTFTEADKAGNNDMLAKGFLGTIYGMNVIKVSTNAGMTATTAYIYDKNHAICCAEKRPVTVEGFEMPVNDMSAASITQRIKYRYIRTKAIAKLTSS